MTRFAMAMALLLLSAGAGLAQDAATLAARVREIRYLPLAALARLQGDVLLHSGPAGVVPISGHPILVQAALTSLERLGKLSERSEVEVVFHFSLTETTVREVTVTVNRGNAFDRLILRVLGFNTEKTMKEKECVVSTDLPENRIDATKTPIEVWVFGRSPCPAISIESAGVATD